MWSALGRWGIRRWTVATAAAIVAVMVIAIPTAMVDSPLFGRQIPTPPWAWPALLVAGILAGLIAATYVRESGPVAGARTRANSVGPAGGVLTFFAVGCPVCNKLVLLALGSAGALQWFAPVQPYLAIAGIALLAWALRARLRGETACPVPGGPADERASA
jgi:hypothetical protein